MRWLFILLACGCASLALAQASANRPAQLPAFQFSTLDGTGVVSKAQLQRGLATVVLFVDPSCEHCQQQAQWLHSGDASLRKVQFLWVGTAPADQLAAFQAKYLKGSRYPHVVARDSKYQFDGWFGYSVSPTILAFDAQGKFRQAWTNEVAASEIARYLN